MVMGKTPPCFPMRQLRLVAVAMVLVAFPSLALAYSITHSRPRLFFTAADVPMLRQRIVTTHADPWWALGTWSQPHAGAFATKSGRDADLTHRYIERNAFMYLMLAESNPVLAGQYAQIAKNWLLELATYEFSSIPNDAFEYLWALALGYDWLYSWPGFSEADKEAVREQLIEHTNVHVNKTGLNGFSTFPTGPASAKSIYDNQSTENNLGNAFAGLALWEPDDRYGTNTSAQRYMDAAYARLREAYKAPQTHAPNGGYWEGQSYAAARLQGEVYFAYVWKVATGEDLIASNNHLRHAVYYWIYGLRPDGLSTREGDQTCLPTGCDRNRFIAEILAHYDPYDPPGYVQWYAHFKGALTGGDLRWSDLRFDWPDIVLYNPALPVREPSDLPFYRHFAFGHVVIRTGWEIGPPSDDTHLTFAIRDWISGHTHLDVNSFSLFRKGALAIDSGRYRGNSVNQAHERNYALRTIAHNTITVYRPGEDFGAFANDGGQEFLWKEKKNPAEPRYVKDLYDGTRFDTGTLEAFEAGSDFYYLKGNATDAYHSKGFNARSDGKEAKISHFTRELAFFPDHPDQPYPMLVVFDRVVSLNANWPKKWLLHAIDEPLVNGTVTGVEVPDKIVRYAGDLVTISHNDGKLFSQTLLPASATIRKVGGTGYEFWVDDPGKNYPPGDAVAQADIEAGAWRVEVIPTTPALTDTFLHVLSLADASVSAAPVATRLDATAMSGAEVSNRVVLFSKTGALVNDVTYTVSSSGTVCHLLTGIAPGTYHVTQNGQSLPESPPIITSSQDTLSFESTDGGIFRVHR
jgi:Heparinase II C-terminal domain/Heparinase II/III-like protein